MEELNTNELQKKLEECEKLRDEYLAGWQRARADLLNYKKDEIERMGDLLKYACEGLILKILPILDNFEIALQTFAKQNLGGQAQSEQIINGFIQIREQFSGFLKEQGVEEIKAVGEKFDPNLHEVVEEVEPASAVGETESAEATAGEAGTILEEIQKGYKINGRLLRPAKVKVAK